jgi:hypothetical protein
MDGKGNDHPFAPPRYMMVSAWWDLVISDRFEQATVDLCRHVIPEAKHVDDPAIGGQQLLALALVTVADLPPRLGRTISADEVALTSGAGEYSFCVVRRLDRTVVGRWWPWRRRELRTRLRISVPPGQGEWLAEFDGDRLVLLEFEP